MNSQRQSKQDEVPVLEEIEMVNIKEEPVEAEDDLEVVHDNLNSRDPYHHSYYVPTLLAQKHQLLAIVQDSTAKLRASQNYMKELERSMEGLLQTGTFIPPPSPPANSLTPELLHFRSNIESKLVQLEREMRGARGQFLETKMDEVRMCRQTIITIAMFGNLHTGQAAAGSSSSSASTFLVPQVITLTPVGPSLMRPPTPVPEPVAIAEDFQQPPEEPNANVDIPAQSSDRFPIIPVGGESSYSSSENGQATSTTTTEANDHFQVPPPEIGMDRPFWCKCGKNYAIKSVLKYHILVQIKGQIFKCEYCDKKFKYNSSVKFHVKRKHGLNYMNRFGCRHCGATFTERSLFDKHRKTCHL